MIVYLQEFIRRNLSAGTPVMVSALMIANVLNFLYSAILGRSLPLEQFALLTVINTFWYISSIFLSGMGATIIYLIAHQVGKHNSVQGLRILKSTRLSATYIAVIVSIVWLLCIPLLMRIFKIQDILSLISVVPLFLLGIQVYSSRSYLQGNFFFVFAGILVIAEAALKLLLTAPFILFGFEQYVYLSLPLGMFCTFIVSIFILSAKADLHGSSEETINFPYKHFFSTILVVFSTTAFVTFDVLIAKHFLSAQQAGVYALLSLTGKIVLFLGSIFSGFIVAYTSRAIGAGKNPTPVFYNILCFSLAASFVGYLLVGPFGHITLGLMLGEEKALSVLQYSSRYAFAIMLFVISNAIVSYHTTKKQYQFSYMAIVIAMSCFGALFIYHQTIDVFVNVVMIVSCVGLMINLLMHLRYNTTYEEIDHITKHNVSGYHLEDITKKTDVAICLTAYNEEKNIGNLLKSLLRQKTHIINIKHIVVVSSASTDRTDDIVREYAQKDPRIKLIQEAERKGKASAINTFLKKYKEPIVVVQSTDTVCHPNCIEYLCRPMVADHQIGMTGGAPVPTNDPHTFLGYVVHTWWWFHRNIPRFGEIIAFRNILPEISAQTAVDEAWIQAKFVQMEYKVVHIDDAVVYNKGSDTVADIIKQRRRIYNGHSRLQKEEGVKISHMTKSMIYLLLFKYKLGTFRHFMWLCGGICIEVIAQILGRWDKYMHKKNPVVWDIATSTKNLSLNFEKEH